MTKPRSCNFWLWFLRTISVWCFLFVTLFNLQGTRRSRRNIAILANFISFVKNFFQKFSTRDPFCPAATRLSYHTLLSLSSPFFRDFSTPLPRPCRSHYLSDSFVRIPNPSSKVNPVFPGLWTFSSHFLFFPKTGIFLGFSLIVHLLLLAALISFICFNAAFRHFDLL